MQRKRTACPMLDYRGGRRGGTREDPFRTRDAICKSCKKTMCDEHEDGVQNHKKPRKMEGATVDDYDEPSWCRQTFTCSHGHCTSGNIIQCTGICEGPHYAAKKCVAGCCVHGISADEHCSCCAADGERYGWDGSLRGCRCLKCFHTGSE